MTRNVNCEIANSAISNKVGLTNFMEMVTFMQKAGRRLRENNLEQIGF